jgi:hypothetical protein
MEIGMVRVEKDTVVIYFAGELSESWVFVSPNTGRVSTSFTVEVRGYG